MRLIRFVAWLTELSLRRWCVFLAAGVVMALAGTWFGSRLTIRTSFQDLLPEDVPSVQNANELVRRVGGDGTVLLVIEAERGPEDLRAAERLASRLAEAMRAMGPDVVRAVEADVGPARRWYSEHWPLFAPTEDLRRARDALVKVLGEQKAKLNPMFDLLGEDDQAAEEEPGRLVDLGDNRELQDLLDPAKPSPRERVEQGFERFVDGYMVHPDHRSVTVIVRAAGTSLGVSEVRVVLSQMQAVVDRFRADADAQHLKVGFGGTYPILLVEHESLLKDATLSFGIVLVILLVSMTAFFGDVRLILALGAALLVAVAVTFGVTYLALGYLNMQTAFLGSIVAGNGVNYGIVYLGRVKQLRRRGVPLEPACHDAARVTASGTLLAAVGTSVAYGTLLLATNRGFRHFGFVGGIGMVLCWGATFALLPSLLVVLERLRPRRVVIRPPRYGWVPPLLERVFAHPRAIVVAFSALTVAAATLYVLRLPVALERNLDRLRNDETGNEEARRVHERAKAALGQSIGGAMALLPSRDGATEYCAAVDARMRQRPRLRELIEGCETITTVIPADQPEKLGILRDLGERLTERVLSHLPRAQAERAREIRAQFLAQRPLGDDDAPATLLDRFRERDGSLGRIAFVRSHPHGHLELVPNLREFADAVRNVPVGGRRYDAAGADIVAADLLADVERQGTRVTALSYVAVCMLVVLFLRGARPSALLIVSFTSGAILMVGVAALADLKINFFNIAAYPITFGIAVDYGANVFSRLRVRRNVVPALVEVAPVMVICSWSTIVSYASLTVSFSRALRSFAWYAMLGEFATLTTAIVFLPAMLKLLPPRLWHAPPGEALDEDEAVRVASQAARTPERHREAG
jgi:predicted RND superfamily exporter protein